MRVVIAGINSQYIHSSLAPWYLKAVCKDCPCDVIVREYTINDRIDSILYGIYCEKPDVLAVSCYIWNIEYVYKIVRTVKKVLPKLVIILGGPEVSYDSESLMEEYEEVDFIISGEGEISFKRLIKFLTGKNNSKSEDNLVRIENQSGSKNNSDNEDESKELWDVPNLTWRHRGKIILNKTEAPIINLDSIPSPYSDEMIAQTEGKIIYYESSRGCPFSCSYCLSSIDKGVRYFSMDRVRKDLMKLINAGVRQVKFVDRTFNCNKARAAEIIKFIIENSRTTSFHFEAAADLFDEEMINLLAAIPEGLIQLEIGVQTTNEKTLMLINRKTSLDKLFENVRKIREKGNIHIHLDLIAGLPDENMESFKKSFNSVYSAKPHNLQLGFLKMLKGSKIREDAEKYGYSYRHYPPYEVLSNEEISFDEILMLKDVEEVLERYYNSSRFQKTLSYIISVIEESSNALTAFDFYRELALYCREKGYLSRPVQAKNLYNILYSYVKQINNPHIDYHLFNDLMKFDFLSTDNTNNLPDCINTIRPDRFQDMCFEFLKNEENIEKYLPHYKGLPAKQIFKKVNFQVFSYTIPANKYSPEMTIILFDYGQPKSPVSGCYKWHDITCEFETQLKNG